MPTPAIQYQTATRANLRPVGTPRFKWPLPQYAPVQQAAYAFDQDHESLTSSLSAPPAKNSPSNATSGGNPIFYLSDANAILTSISQPAISGAGMGKFSTSFARVPASWNDFTKSQPFSFPGFPGLLGRVGTRDPFTDIVETRMQYDYYVLDPQNVISTVTPGTPGTATSVLDSGGGAVNCVYQLSDIPLIAKTFFVVAYLGTPDFTNRTNSLTPSGGVTFGNQTFIQTLPVKANYQTWISNAASAKWSSSVWDGATDSGGSYGQLVVDDSKIIPYVGNIVARVTTFVLTK